MPHVQSTYSMILCQLLIQEMGHKNITQQEFFDRSGISQATWSRINRGLSHFGIEDLRVACHTLSINLPVVIEKAEEIAHNLPKMDVEVISPIKAPRGPNAKNAAPPSTTNVATAVIAAAALAFLISRIIRS